MRQIYPEQAELSSHGLAAAYRYPSRHPGQGRWLRANMVMSADGAASLRGRSGGLSGPADQQVFALLRALADVIVVGAGTARTERYGQIRPEVEGTQWAWLREGRSPAAPIAVLTRGLDLDPTSALLAPGPGQARAIVITSGAAPPDRLATVASTADVIVAGEQDVDLAAAADALATRGYQRILTEGGPHLLQQLIGAELLDELCLTLSPLLAGPGPGRIVAGQDGANGPDRLTLAHVLADGDYLFCRYVRRA